MNQENKSSICDCDVIHADVVDGQEQYTNDEKHDLADF